MLTGETRHQPAVTLVPHEQSDARFSRVTVFRREISTLFSATSSVAEPEKVIGLPGATVIGFVGVGGFITAGVVIETLGGMAVALTSQVRAALRRSAWPAVSIAVACIFHSPS